MPKSVVRKTVSAVKKVAKKAKSATKKAASKAGGKPAAAPKKRVGDVLGVSSTHVPKAKKAIKSSGRKREGIGVVTRSTGIDHLTPARVRG